MSRLATIYRLSDGAIVRLYSGDAPDAQLVEGEAFIEGHFNPLCNRVNLSTAKAEKFVPTPSPGMEWDDGSSSFIATASARAIREAKAGIADLELAQPRILRERDLGDLSQQEAKDMLRAIDDKIIPLRKIIKDNGG